jgi:pyruvate formate lyase activating enzyme
MENCSQFESVGITSSEQMEPFPDESDEHVLGRWWERTGDGEKIQCKLCPRNCVLKSGDRGFCFVRQNRGGQMYLTTYGLSTGFCVDPIEKKPLNHFLPGSSVLTFGTAGCNLGCRFCQNWSISKSREVNMLSERASPDEIAEAAVRLGCSSVAFSYNDPVIWAEYAIDTAKACRERGLKTVAVTAGYITPEARPEFYSVMDAANVDLKAFSEVFYQHLCLARLEPILDTLKWLKQETDVWFEITNLIIPEENDSSEEIKRMCDWILQNLGAEVPLHFTAFHPDFKLLNRPATPAATLIRARQQALDAGLKYPYVGNVFASAGSSTYCPACRSCVVEREWFELGEYQVKDNCCVFCGQLIAGVWSQTKGNWGRQRLPVSIR